MSARRILVVDDDDLFCDALVDALAVEGITVVPAHSAHEARARATEGFPVVVIDNRIEGGDGLSLVPELIRAHPRVKVILCTGFPELDNAVAALRLGLFDYLSKPVDLAVLTAAVRRGLRQFEPISSEGTDEHRRSAERRDIVLGGSTATAVLRETITRAAHVRAPVLITGETGTGKTLIARTIHAEGSPSRPFVHVNCAALPVGLVESELFGSERGSFTGACQTREGLFELADGGTLFLDEVGELDAPIQAKLLTALEEGWVRRVGGARPRRVEVRIIAATNADVETAVTRGSLRADLYYRLNVVRLDLPPLRHRIEELPELCAHLLDQLTGGRGATLADGELAALAAHDWPGNTRELRNVLERALVLQGPGPLRPSVLLARRAPESAPPIDDGALVRTDTARVPPPRGDDGIVPLAELERRHVLAALESSRGNRAHAARALGVSVATLRRKLREYGVVSDQIDPSERSL
ncbi:Response regulator of zinc sigma-54-dependent two-component system [Minicystis rosea]|nr:Response regulator of zinc sigma-54-dependent two-component system [Minicystis rosea]